MLPDCESPIGAAAGRVLYPIATLWTFVGMSFVAEEYFSVALDGIVSKYKIPDAVAGATILAVGTSFPELIIGFVSQFLSSEADPSITLGVTLGSAIFNQLAIVGACAVAAAPLRVNWRAMLRDVLVWTLTMVLATVLMADGVVSALDGWLLVGLYVVYVILCKYWHVIDARLEARVGKSHKPPPKVLRMVLPLEPRDEAHAVYVPSHPRKLHLGDFLDVEKETKAHADKIKMGEALKHVGTAKRCLHHVGDSRDEDAPGASQETPEARDEEVAARAPDEPTSKQPSAENPHPSYERPAELAKVDSDHHFHEDEGPFGGPWPADHPVWDKAHYVAKIPFAFVCHYAQLPVLRRKHYVFASALIAGSFIACISYFMVQWLERSACLLGVPTITLSLLFAASGTCLPELVVALVVAKKGQGTAAVSTALGSNIFDILCALGLPWAVYASAVEPVHIDNATVLTAIMIGSTGLFLFFCFTSNWTFSAWHGYVMLAVYALFNVYVAVEAIPSTNIPGPAN